MSTSTLSKLLVVMVLLSACQAPKQQESFQLGQLNHQFKINKSAQEPFERGLLLLHSFEYDDAREAFIEARTNDPSELMAYWGEAMSHYKALWGLQNEDSGKAVIQRAGMTQDNRYKLASGPLELDFWKGIEILYGEGSLDARNQAYADHMADLYERYPDNQEVAAFYALALMWTESDGRTQEASGLSAQIAKGILEENPLHPGALHYLIHANDDPDYAALSIAAANEYADVAPDATHALHMPSHIYLAMGMWNEMVHSNENSYAASVNRMERKGLGDEARGYHSYAWLHYGYLQQGRFDKAEKLLRDMHHYVNSVPVRYTRRYLISMQNAQLVESGQWIEGLEPMIVNIEDLSLTSQAGQLFFQSMLAYEKGDSISIAAHTDSLENKIAAAELIVIEKTISVCGTGPTRYAPDKSDILRAQVMVNQMNAFISILAKDTELTELYLMAATNLEEEAEYSYGPPDIPYPSFEQYGEWLLTQDRPKEALEMFEKSLAVAKNRTRALDGKINALNLLGQPAAIDSVRMIIKEFWVGIDSTDVTI
ncbi:hypothetical protein [Reichenbachiella ulvae]|uniref:Tetratricopeptide repeat-containing protein n=1 Tax=Reichenbachiella ulvae TaxID=2980104 RepID=A0ABT3CRX7_9BACT|nr:hypothetical protein [Reichenbachiella ulvae]MCV9386023.1 hypothetical protein [Reichenbachiella ulvae]